LLEIGTDFEIILVDDASPDHSWKEIKTLAEVDSRVKGLQLSRNFGQHYAITAGIDYAQGEWVVVMDCDLQDRPEEIARLYAKALEGYDVVFARRGKRHDSLVAVLGSKIYNFLIEKLSGFKHDAGVANFSIFSATVAVNFRQVREQLRSFVSIMNWMGFRKAFVDVAQDPRFEGESSYSFSRRMRLAIDTIVSFSNRPLTLAIKLGFSVAALAGLAGLAIIYKAIFLASPVTGWASIMVSIYFMGGIILGFLGFIGIYLGKTFDEAKKRPVYLVREFAGVTKNAD
jgi:glycosyltransferase involved in cell wall biosynthesis